jgi:hypothetical protein
LFTETTKGQSKEGCAAQNIDERNVASVPSAEVELGSTRPLADRYLHQNKFQYQAHRGEPFRSVNGGGGFYRLPRGEKRDRNECCSAYSRRKGRIAN